MIRQRFTKKRITPLTELMAAIVFLFFVFLSIWSYFLVPEGEQYISVLAFILFSALTVIIICDSTWLKNRVKNKDKVCKAGKNMNETIRFIKFLFCAAKVTAGNIGYSIIGASGVWCNEPECMRTAKRWRKKFLKQNLRNNHD
jgi:uncharacterized membrane protein YciS (DUF1049 family)